MKQSHKFSILSLFVATICMVAGMVAYTNPNKLMSEAQLLREFTEKKSHLEAIVSMTAKKRSLASQSEWDEFKRLCKVCSLETGISRYECGVYFPISTVCREINWKGFPPFWLCKQRGYLYTSNPCYSVVGSVEKNDVNEYFVIRKISGNWYIYQRGGPEGEDTTTLDASIEEIAPTKIERDSWQLEPPEEFFRKICPSCS
jgi:hypothetical protein